MCMAVNVETFPSFLYNFISLVHLRDLSKIYKTLLTHVGVAGAFTSFTKRRIHTPAHRNGGAQERFLRKAHMTRTS